LGYHVTGTFVYVSRFSSSESAALLERRWANSLCCRAWEECVATAPVADSRRAVAADKGKRGSIDFRFGQGRVRKECGWGKRRDGK
jgi:hypothetical protein